LLKVKYQNVHILVTGAAREELNQGQILVEIVGEVENNLAKVQRSSSPTPMES
jgi:hypothetical protein